MWQREVRVRAQKASVILTLFLHAVLGFSVWSLQIHAWRGEMRPGPWVTLVWSCWWLCPAVGAPCEKVWARSGVWNSCGIKLWWPVKPYGVACQAVDLPQVSGNPLDVAEGGKDYWKDVIAWG